jgi:hypothetical protein
MPDLNAIAGMTALRSQTKGDPLIKIAVLDGLIDLDIVCFQSANMALPGLVGKMYSKIHYSRAREWSEPQRHKGHKDRSII